MPAEGAVQPAVATVGFDDAVAGFLGYLSAYRGYSIHTVKAYARDLREFRRLLAQRYGSVRQPNPSAGSTAAPRRCCRWWSRAGCPCRSPPACPG